MAKTALSYNKIAELAFEKHIRCSSGNQPSRHLTSVYRRKDGKIRVLLRNVYGTIGTYDYDRKRRTTNRVF